MCLRQVIKSFQNYRGVATTFYPTLVYRRQMKMEEMVGPSCIFSSLLKLIHPIVLSTMQPISESIQCVGFIFSSYACDCILERLWALTHLVHFILKWRPIAILPDLGTKTKHYICYLKKFCCSVFLWLWTTALNIYRNYIVGCTFWFCRSVCIVVKSDC